MTLHASNAARRRLIKLAVTGMAAAPVAALLSRTAAAAADMLSETDPTAKALNYVADAAKSTKRTDKTATCAGCNFYSGKADAVVGPCAIFPTKAVNAKGWCSSWLKKV
jgi:High potential iron-sulfur protein